MELILTVYSLSVKYAQKYKESMQFIDNKLGNTYA